MAFRDKPFVFALIFGVLCVGGAALAQQPSATTVTKPTASAGTSETQRHAVAVLRPTSGNQVGGVVRFEETAEGVRVTTRVTDLPGGKHAYHVHVYGDCSTTDASSAGPHFRFGPSDTGITGNLGELEPAAGRGYAERVIPGATLRGERSIVGRSVVVHAKGNDPTQPPDGAAGARLACGVIGIDDAVAPAP